MTEKEYTTALGYGEITTALSCLDALYDCEQLNQDDLSDIKRQLNKMQRTLMFDINISEEE